MKHSKVQPSYSKNSVVPMKGKYGCRPMDKTKAGTKHILNSSVGDREFYWTGDGWSSNANLQWQTSPAPMSALGWSYVRPVIEEVSHEG